MYNMPHVPRSRADLIWWQPLADVVEKFKAGGMPAPGQVRAGGDAREASSAVP